MVRTIFIKHHQISAVYTFPFSFCKIYFNIALPLMPTSLKWHLSLTLPQQNPVCISSILHTCHMSCLFLPSLFCCCNNVWWQVQLTKLHIMQFSPISSYLPPLRTNILLIVMLWSMLSLYSSFNIRNEVVQWYRASKSFILGFIFFHIFWGHQSEPFS